MYEKNEYLDLLGKIACCRTCKKSKIIKILHCNNYNINIGQDDVCQHYYPKEEYLCFNENLIKKNRLLSNVLEDIVRSKYDSSKITTIEEIRDMAYKVLMEV